MLFRVSEFKEEIAILFKKKELISHNILEMKCGVTVWRIWRSNLII